MSNTNNSTMSQRNERPHFVLNIVQRIRARRQSLLGGLVLTLCLLGIAAPVAAEHPAQELVVSTVENLLSVVRKDAERLKNDPAYLDAKVNELIVPNLDFEAMTKLSVGKHWRKANAEQRASLVEEFTQFLLATYTSAIDEFKGGEVSFEKFKPQSREDRAVVRSSFSQSGSSDVPVNYKLHNKNGWKIYNIEVDKLSLVTNYRSSFSSEIDRNGIDGLISLLKSRNGNSG